MRHIWLIVRYEYWRFVRRRSFIVTALGLPLLALGLIGAIVLVATRSGVEQRLGLVDQTGRFAAIDVAALDLSRPIPLERFADENAARQALERQQIDAYAVIPADYLESGAVRAVGPRRLSDRAQSELEALLRAGLIAEAPPAARARLDEPTDLVLRTLDGGREVGASNGLLFLVPYGFAMLFIFTTFTTSGYLLQAITEEKEDRIIELLATTVSPQEMMAGKIIGLSAVGLTQMLAWITVGALCLLALVRDVSWISDFELPWSLIGLSLLFFVLGYLLIATCYATLGAAVTTPQEAQPLAAPISLTASAPLFMLAPILADPNGTLAVVLSLIPFSAPMTMLMRLPLAEIPLWQLALSLALLLGSVIGVILLSARVMRLGMLRTGKRLSLREMFSGTSARL
jgi:ABC-2 type transport system permease protein